MGEVPILGQGAAASEDPAPGHHGELVDRDAGDLVEAYDKYGMTPPDRAMQDIRDREDEESEPPDDEDDIGDPWHVIARDQDWIPEEIVAKRQEVAAEVTEMMRDAARKGIAIGGLGPELVLRLLIRRVFVGTTAMYPPGHSETHGTIPDREPLVECELFLLYVAEEQHRMLTEAAGEMRKAELAQPMVAGPGGLLVPGNRAQRRAELKDRRRSERKG